MQKFMRLYLRYIAGAWWWLPASSSFSISRMPTVFGIPPPPPPPLIQQVKIPCLLYENTLFPIKEGVGGTLIYQAYYSGMRILGGFLKRTRHESGQSTSGAGPWNFPDFPGVTNGSFTSSWLGIYHSLEGEILPKQ
jgi:hypothetical protein